MRTHAHIMVAKLAAEMAQARYEDLARDNRWYALHNRDAWVRHNAPHFIGQARATLTDMLNSPGVSDREKEQIYEALLADNFVPRSGTPVAH